VKAWFIRVLDLGCGSGRELASWGVTASDEVTGLDIAYRCAVVAKGRFPNRAYLQGAGEYLPFEDESFDRVISSVALPSMNIPKTLAENSPHFRSRWWFVAKPPSAELHDS
jgi:ubiquinone/menaquinone biosynthesis C-methylase UbiE